MRRATLFTVVVMLGLVAPVAAGAVAAPGQLVLIVDSSGSMRAELGKQTRMAIAKKVLRELITSLPADLRAGLILYGHRRKKDCKDVEQVIPLSPLDKAAFLAKLEPIRPKGKTPITRSIRLAAKTLEVGNGPATILLVSDGKETCNADPCALVRELKAAGASFTLHVVGFGVTEQEKSQLACIAEAGGGRFATAADARELEVAMGEALSAPEFTAGTLEVMVLKQGAPFRAVVEAYAEGGPRQAGAFSERDRPATLRLRPGRYRIRVSDTTVVGAPAREVSGVEITAGKTEKRSVDLAGNGTLRIIAKKAGQPYRALVQVFDRNGDRQVKATYTTGASELDRDAHEALELPAGSYRIVLTDLNVLGKPKRTLDAVLVRTDQTTEAVAELLVEGTLEVTATRGGQRFRALLTVDDAAGRRMHQAYAPLDGPARFALPAGSYEVSAIDNETKERRTIGGIEVESGRVVTRTVAF